MEQWNELHETQHPREAEMVGRGGFFTSSLWYAERFPGCLWSHMNQSQRLGAGRRQFPMSLGQIQKMRLFLALWEGHKCLSMV